MKPLRKLAALLLLLCLPAVQARAQPRPAGAAPTMKSPPARPFEELLKDAVPVTDLATLIEPLYAQCKEMDDVGRRQCQTMRDFLLEKLGARTYVALADVLPEASPYDASAREAEIEVSGCLACSAPPVIAGEPRYLATRPPQKVVAGKAVGAHLATHSIPFETKVLADRFTEHVAPRLRVQHVFRIGAPFPEVGGRSGGVAILPVAHRVYDACTGKVLAGSHVSKEDVKVVPDKRCPRKGTEELSQAEMAAHAERMTLPERLTPSQVESALEPMRARIHECYMEFEEHSGTVRVQLTVGGDGKLTHIGLSPPYDKAAIGVCIRAQLKSAVFPRFRGDPMRIEYAFQVN